MNICDKCKGDGLIGQGDNPHLKQGRLETCTECNGTGKVADVSAPAQEENAPVSEPVNSEVSSTVDNGPLADAPSSEVSSDASDAGGAPAEEPAAQTA